MSNFKIFAGVKGVPPTMGAVLLGNLISTFFSGIVTMQTFLYYRIYPNDAPRLKIMVSLIWILDLMHTCMLVATSWTYLIAHFGNSEVSDSIPPTVPGSIAVTAVLTFATHCFFSHRIYTLSRKNLFIVIPIVITAAFRMSLSFVTSGEMIRFKSYTLFGDQFSWVITTGLALAVAVDTLIATFISAYLNTRRTGFSSMDAIIDSITLYTVESGILTSLAALASLISWVTMPHNLIFLSLQYLISKLYANALLATLNARKTLRGRSQGSSDRSDHPMPVMFPENYNRGSRMPFPTRSDAERAVTPKVQISVEKTIERDVDGTSAETITMHHIKRHSLEL